MLLLTLQAPAEQIQWPWLLQSMGRALLEMPSATSVGKMPFMLMRSEGVNLQFKKSCNLACGSQNYLQYMLRRQRHLGMWYSIVSAPHCGHKDTLEKAP